MSRIREDTLTGAATYRARLVTPDRSPCVWRFDSGGSYYLSKMAWSVVAGEMTSIAVVQQDLGDSPDSVEGYMPGVVLLDYRTIATATPGNTTVADYFDGAADVSSPVGAIYTYFRNGGAIDILLTVASV